MICRRLAPLSVLLVTALAGCATAQRPPPPAAGGPPDASASAVVSASGTGSPPAPTDLDAPTGPGGFSTTDVAWLQLTIAMDERILRVLDLVPDRVNEPEIAALAVEFATAHRSALSRLRALYDRAGGPRANPHEGHDMPGMATGAQLDALRGATGHAAVDIFAAAMRAHLDQAVRLARAAREHGSDPATRTAAAETERVRAGQRGRLDQLLPARASPAPA